MFGARKDVGPWGPGAGMRCGYRIYSCSCRRDPVCVRLVAPRALGAISGVVLLQWVRAFGAASMQMILRAELRRGCSQSRGGPDLLIMPGVGGCRGGVHAGGSVGAQQRRPGAPMSQRRFVVQHRMWASERGGVSQLWMSGTRLGYPINAKKFRWEPSLG